MLHRTDPAGGHERQNARKERMKTIVIGLDQDIAGACGRLDHFAGLPGIHGKGLFAQHVLACLESGDRPARVTVRWQAVVDEVDRVAPDQRFVVALDLRDSMVFRELCCARRITCRDGSDLDAAARGRGG
mgnify:CR=1 FL=1